MISVVSNMTVQTRSQTTAARLHPPPPPPVVDLEEEAPHYKHMEGVFREKARAFKRGDANSAFKRGDTNFAYGWNMWFCMPPPTCDVITTVQWIRIGLEERIWTTHGLPEEYKALLLK